MTTTEFVRNLFENSSEYINDISAYDAALDLANFRADGWDLPEDITPETYAEEWNRLAFDARLSDKWDAIVNLMDDENRETVHAELAPCTEREFLARYLELDPEFRAVLKAEFSVEM